MELISQYFPDLTPLQINQFAMLPKLYDQWNAKINVVSRKDLEHLVERHILHSLAIAKILKPIKGTTFMDVGTGGGFPGIPMAIMFPECSFYLIDSIGKKIIVVRDIISNLELKNAKADKIRVEEVATKFDFILSRAVTDLNIFYRWTINKVSNSSTNNMVNGILYLKGGDIENEVKSLKAKVKIFEISNFFTESFYQTKKIIHIYNT